MPDSSGSDRLYNTVMPQCSTVYRTHKQLTVCNKHSCALNNSYCFCITNCKLVFWTLSDRVVLIWGVLIVDVKCFEGCSVVVGPDHWILHFLLFHSQSNNIYKVQGCCVTAKSRVAEVFLSATFRFVWSGVGIYAFFAECLDELAGLVQELFSPIQNKNVPIPSFPEPPYSENELQVSNAKLSQFTVT